MGYDALNRMTSELEPFGQSLNFGFDAVGNRIFVRDSNGGVTRSTYDAANRLVSRQFTGVGQTPVRADFTYTVRDQVASITVSSLAALDLAELYNSTNPWNVSLAGASPSSWGSSPATVTYLHVVTGDFNGDGLTDVAEMDTNGKEKATLQGHSQCVNSVAFSPDGKILASGSHVFNKKAQVVSGEVKLWDVAIGKNTANITAHTYLVFCVTFSPDGKTLVSASDETIRLWDVIGAK
jgi:YD repeat-containing protein